MSACRSPRLVSRPVAHTLWRHARRVTTIALTAALLVPSGRADARQTAPDAGPDAVAGDDEGSPDAVAAEQLAQAQRLYDEGRVKFETADYNAAIDRWTEAYAYVPDTPGSARIKALLIYNLATARERVFDVTQDAAQLRQAKILLEGFEASLPQLYTDEELQAERDRVQERIAGVQTRLDAAVGDDAPDPVDPVDPDDRRAPPSGDQAPTNAGRGLVIGGAVAISVGVAGLGIMGAGLGIGAGANDIAGLADDDITGRRAQFDKGRTGNALAIAGGVVGAVGIVTGAVLLGVGLHKQRRVALSSGPGLVGIGLRGRF